MLISYKRGQGSIILRVKIRNSSVSTGAGLTGLTSASAGLIISTIADNEATATAYTVAGSTIETITTLGTYAAPTATKCRFKEVDATNHKGIYEIQLADARYNVANAKSLLVSISGATNAAECDAVIPLRDLDPYDAVRAGLTALPNAAAGANGGLPLGDAAGRVDIGKLLGTAWLTPAVAGTPDVNVKLAGGTAWASGSLTAGVFAAGAINAAAIADGAIDRATFAADTGLQTIRSNTAQAGGATTITLDAAASATNDAYKGLLCYITGGTGVGQSRLITGYAGATKVATVDWAWITNPDATSTFALLASGDPSLNSSLQVATTASDPWGTSLPGAYGAGTAGYILGTNLDAQVTSRLAPTTAGRTLDVTATGEAGIDWANIGGPATAQNLSGTTISTSQVVASVSGAVGSVTGNVGGNVTGSVGSVAAGGISSASFAADTGMQSIRSNTAQAGGATSITLDAAASATTDFYKGRWIRLTGGTGSGQVNLITAYNGTTKVATVHAIWATNPDVTTTFAVLNAADVQGVVLTDTVSVVSGGVTVTTNNDKTGYSLANGSIVAATFAAGAIDAAAIATDAIGSAELSAAAANKIVTAVWVDLLASTDFSTVGSIGKLLKDNVDVAISSRLASASYTAPSNLTAAQIATGVWQDTTAGDFTTAGSIGKSLFTSGNAPGAASGLALVGSNMGTTTSLTGDAFARLGAPAGASVSADVAAVKTDTGALVTRITSTLFSGITYLSKWLGVIAGKTADAGTLAEIQATPAGLGFLNSTDSLEAIRDRGDAAWTTGAGGGGGVVGSGANAVTVTVTVNGNPVADAGVWLTSDEAGTVVVAGTLRTNSNGQAVFMLDNGATYYLWAQKDGINSIRARRFTAVAD